MTFQKRCALSVPAAKPASEASDSATADAPVMPDAMPAHITALDQLLNGSNMTSLSEAANDFYNDVMGFAHAIDWNERWLMYLGAFHVMVWILAIGLRKSHDALMVFLVAILGSVYCAEWINTYAGQHWQSFAGQNYFDKRGVFVSVMYSGNLLMVALFVLLYALRTASSLLIKVKRKEIRANAKAKAKAQ